MRRLPRTAIGWAQWTIVLLTLCGWLLSYRALQLLAEQHDYPGWSSWLVPITVDLLALSCALLGLSFARAHRGPAGEAWALAGVSALVTLGGNTASAAMRADPIGVVLHAWPAVCMLGAWHLYFRSVPAPARPAAAAARTRRGTKKRRSPVVRLPDGRQVSAGHARKLRAQERRLEVAPGA